MIEPTRRDLGREVAFRRGDGSTATGRLADFNAEYLFVNTAGLRIPVRRSACEWPATRREDARSIAARSAFESAGLAVEVIDEHEWRIAGYRYWPSQGLWQRPDDSQGGGGAAALLADWRKSQPRRPQDPPGSSDAA
jgi:hypothetical protein